MDTLPPPPPSAFRHTDVQNCVFASDTSVALGTSKMEPNNKNNNTQTDGVVAGKWIREVCPVKTDQLPINDSCEADNEK